MQAGSPVTVRQTVRDLLDNPRQLQTMRERSATLSHPTAALDVARLLAALADRSRGEPAAPDAFSAAPPHAASLIP